MRFVDFLRATVMSSGVAATTLALVTVLRAAAEDVASVALAAAGWWLAAALVGAWLGRGSSTTPAIARLLASARASSSLPEQRPGVVLVNRLWPLLVVTAGATVLGLFFAQVSGIAAGFAIIWALTWRRQDAAVRAIEERDGAVFFLAETSPFRPISLVRTPGFRRGAPTL